MTALSTSRFVDGFASWAWAINSHKPGSIKPQSIQLKGAPSAFAVAHARALIARFQRE